MTGGRHRASDSAQDGAQSEAERYLDQIADVLLRVAAGDFEARVERVFDGRSWDAVAFLINATSEELGVLFAEGAEQRLRLKEVASAHFERRSSSWATMLAGLAHEISTPMAVAQGNLEVALAAIEKADSLSFPDLRTQLLETLTDCDQAVAGVAELVANLKALSSEPEGNQVVFDLGKAVDSSVAMLRGVLEERGSVTCEHEEVTHVLGDHAEFCHTIVHLAQNAVLSFPPNRPKSQNYVEIKTSQRDGMAVVSVRDNGMGIEPDTLVRIFDEFFSTRSVGAGIGLGLSVSRRNVEAMGGRVEVESAVDVGSTFRVVLPLHQHVNEERVSVGITSTLSTTVGRVLVIDDHQIIGALVERMLGDDFDVESVTDAVEGLKLAETGRFDVVFCDLMMPNLSGQELYESLLTTHPHEAEKVTFVTGGALTAGGQLLLREMEPLGRVLYKPFTGEALRSVAGRPQR